jgi:hypothetical protein
MFWLFTEDSGRAQTAHPHRVPACIICTMLGPSFKTRAPGPQVQARPHLPACRLYCIYLKTVDYLHSQPT